MNFQNQDVLYFVGLVLIAGDFSLATVIKRKEGVSPKSYQKTEPLSTLGIIQE